MTHCHIYAILDVWLIRTTLRIKENLKKTAERIALENNTTLQSVFNSALQDYISKTAKQKAKKLIIKPISLGVPLDNLTRDDYYDEPRF